MGRRRAAAAVFFLMLIVATACIAGPALDSLRHLANRSPIALTLPPQVPGDLSVSPHSGGTDKSKSGPGGCLPGSPYGFTTIHADAQLVSAYSALKVCWVRLQIHESDLQTAAGGYDWSRVDAAVSLLNAAGIHIDFPIQCFGGSCFSNPTLPTVAQLAQYAGALASRYDGRHGHGLIEAFEIGNEEYDFFPPAVYGPLLKAGYQAIKAVYPSALVGMYGIYRSFLPHIQAVLGTLVSGGYANYFDFANFHYYAHGGDPHLSTADHPSFDAEWQAVHALLPAKPIWVTEVGWTTTPLPGIQSVPPQTQASYLVYVTRQAADSGVVQRIFWFTLDYGTQGDSIDPPTGPQPAYWLLQAFIQQRPTWA